MKDRHVAYDDYPVVTGARCNEERKVFVKR